MTREFAPRRLDVPGFAEASASLSGSDPVQAYARLSAELAGPATDSTVEWTAVGQRRTGADGSPVSWLHLNAETRIPLTCQRCLAPVDVDLVVDRWFRFAPDEAAAAAEDEESEEDVLVSSREFDLHALIEDELLMEIPVTPRHEVCPEPMKLSAVDPDFESAENARPNPFAVLGALRSDKPK
ncbi:YceD family protein [Variovorax sp. GT1P44]|uniref:YceD family protein n=1 Tax=Variovorax sp. GT1P44 TaxID=3443742 RepID=UPI003F485E5D